MLKSLLITNDLDIYNQADIAKIDVVISITDDGAGFRIAKNRYGFTTSGPTNLPITFFRRLSQTHREY